MDANDKNFLDFFFKNLNQFIIPVFQRNYDWDKKNCLVLYQDIESCVKTQKQHFLGSLVHTKLLPDSQTDIYTALLIDGQQRLTTIFLILKAIHDVSDNELDKEACEDYLFNKDRYHPEWKKDEKNRLKLKSIKSDEEQLQLLIDDKLDKMNPSSNIYQNYQYFCSLVRKSVANGISCKDLINCGLKSLNCVQISLDEDDDPQIFFERINSTGKPLTLADLVRNLVLMKEKDSQELYDDYWLPIEDHFTGDASQFSSFIIDFLNFRNTDFATMDTAYQQFKDYLEKNGITHQQVLEDMRTCAEYYSVFLGHPNTYSAAINDELSMLRTMQQSTIYIFLFQLFIDEKAGIITEDDLAELLHFFTNYCLRRYICGIPSNSLRGLFKFLYKRIFIHPESKASSAIYKDTIYAFMLSIKTKDAVPTDYSFKDNLKKTELYGKAKICRKLLMLIENYGSKEQIKDSDDLSIEHIMPQKDDPTWAKAIGEEYPLIHETYLHTLGNLTITGYNSELGAKPFADKVKLIQDKGSKVAVLNDDVVNKLTWGKTEIEARADRLSTILAEKVYPLPNKDGLLVPVVDNGELLTVEDKDKTKGKRPTSFTLQGETFVVSSWVDMLSDVLDYLYEEDSETMSQLANSQEKIPYIVLSYHPEGLIRPQEIKDSGIYFEKNLSSPAILGFLESLLNAYKLEDNDLVFSLGEEKTTSSGFKYGVNSNEKLEMVKAYWEQFNRILIERKIFKARPDNESGYFDFNYDQECHAFVDFNHFGEGLMDIGLYWSSNHPHYPEMLAAINEINDSTYHFFGVESSGKTSAYIEARLTIVSPSNKETFTRFCEKLIDEVVKLKEFSLKHLS
jgi:hypothetical protein